MNVLPRVEQSMRTVIGFVDFNEGHRYEEMVLGAVAAKAGFYKLLWVEILAFKKLIVAGLAAIGIWLRRVFGRQKQTPQAPSPPPTAA